MQISLFFFHIYIESSNLSCFFIVLEKITVAGGQYLDNAAIQGGHNPVLHPSVHTPIILGRHFLTTTNALINCKNGRMQLTFGSMTLELNIFHVAKQSHEDDDCAYVNLIGAVVQEKFNKNFFLILLKLFLIILLVLMI